MFRPAALLIPTAFVLLWSTGFVSARLVAPFADPLTFLALRFAAASLLLAGLAALARAAWPAGPAAWRNALLAGILLHGLYLGGVFWAVAHGLPAGVSALIAATQPLLTALAAPLALSERVGPRRWFGIWLGLAGVALVLGPRLAGAGAYPPATLVVSALSTVAITAGTLWQKRTGQEGDLRTIASVQYAGAAAVTGLAALLLEAGRLVPAPELLFGFAWSVGALSLGAIALLLLMLRRGGAVGVASLLFLVPPFSAVMAFGLFGESLSAIQVFGMAVAAAGVAFASRP